MVKKIGSSVLGKGGSGLSKEQLEKKLEAQRKKTTKTVYDKYKDKFEALAPGIKVNILYSGIGMDVDIPSDRGDPGRYSRNYSLRLSYDYLGTYGGPKGWKWIFTERVGSYGYRYGSRTRPQETIKVRTTKSDDINKILIKTESMFKLVKEEMEYVQKSKLQTREGANVLKNRFPGVKTKKASPRSLEGTIGETIIKINIQPGEDDIYNLSMTLQEITEDSVKDFLKLIQLVG